MMRQPSRRALAAYICRATDPLRLGWQVFPHLIHRIASFRLSSLVKEIFTLSLKIGRSPLRLLRAINFSWDHSRQRSCTCSILPVWFCSSSITLETSFGLAWLITAGPFSTRIFRFHLPYGMFGRPSPDHPLPSSHHPPASR